MLVGKTIKFVLFKLSATHSFSHHWLIDVKHSVIFPLYYHTSQVRSECLTKRGE